ncbi:MAG: class I SAM-dependent methyltransferase [Ginsengibacter sp.]
MKRNEFRKWLTRKIILNKNAKKVRNLFFPGSASYWEKRYQKNGNSGNGSYGRNADYKASFINNFVSKNDIQKIIEFGCGDGNQLKHFQFPSYAGLDVSATAIEKCRQVFKADSTKRFFLYDQKDLLGSVKLYRADLALSLDVIFHLVEDEVFEAYMFRLFKSSSGYVIIYAWDVEGEKKFHVRHRCFTKWIQKNIPEFRLQERISCHPGDNFCDFFIYKSGQA